MAEGKPGRPRGGKAPPEVRAWWRQQKRKQKEREKRKKKREGKK